MVTEEYVSLITDACDELIEQSQVKYLAKYYLLSIINTNETKFFHVTLVFDDCSQFSAHKGSNPQTHNS